MLKDTSLYKVICFHKSTSENIEKRFSILHIFLFCLPSFALTLEKEKCIMERELERPCEMINESYFEKEIFLDQLKGQYFGTMAK